MAKFKGSVILLNQYLSELKDSAFENDIPYLYLDSEGNLTVGVGHNVNSHGDLLDLPFVVKRFERKAVKGGDKGKPIAENKVLNRKAREAEIQNDADFLKKHSGLKKYLPEYLQDYTTLELTDDGIQDLFVSDLNDAYDAVETVFGKAPFAAFPVSCQAGLIDLQFNTGNIGGFSTLIGAVKGEGDFKGKSWKDRWTAAAKACHRKKPVSEERNNKVLQWFMQGAQESKGAAAP